MPHIVVGTAGHIDHGKTALVKALTGIDADRLKEEKERGITIDLGFANLELDHGNVISFIDVPGHERFIKNMLAGAGGLDAVMLVIAADEAVKPQTREHLDICSLLRVRYGFTVLTKVDKTPADLVNINECAVREFLKGSFLENAPILRVSCINGDGVPEIVRALRRLVETVRREEVGDVFRLPVDRCFTMKGFGAVVTGTLLAGRVRKGDEIEILPGGRRTRVRGLQVHGKPASEAIAGQRTAVNLHAVEVSEVGRGMVLSAPNVLKATSMLDCDVHLLASAPGSINMRKRVRFHIGSAELIGYLVLLGSDRLDPGQSGRAQIRLQSPTVAVSGDRFIIRQYSPMRTIGGGEVLDASPSKHRRMDPKILDRLEVIRATLPSDRLKMFADEIRPKQADKAAVPSLSSAEIALRNAVGIRFREYGLKVPAPDAVLNEFKLDRTAGRNLVRQLVREMVLVKVSDDLVLHHETSDRLIAAIRGLKARGSALDVAEFKKLTGLSRKYAIPLLEYLDRQRVTRKNGSDRTIV